MGVDEYEGQRGGGGGGGEVRLGGLAVSAPEFYHLDTLTYYIKFDRKTFSSIAPLLVEPIRRLE